MHMHSAGNVIAIYTDIGRGHPNYLDSVLRYLEHAHPERLRNIRVTSVFEISSGLSLFGWKTIRRMYRLGARGGIVSSLYGRFRARQSEYDPESTVTRLLRRDLLGHLKAHRSISICLVAHPLLANMLKERHRVFYLHGEIAAPRESAVTGIDRVYVPLPETAKKMRDAGVSSESLVETGLVLEPELCEDLDNVAGWRVRRIETRDLPLTVGFFISGSYPRRHIELMIRGAESLRRAKHKVRFFWGHDGSEIRKLMARVLRFDSDARLDSGSGTHPAECGTVVITGESRYQETVRSARCLPELDIFCAAPHERVNWAAGAGLPMIMIIPPIGTFAPENLEFVIRSKCGFALASEADYDRLPDLLDRLRNEGDLSRMVTAGRTIQSVHGARVIAEDLINAMDE